MIYLFHGTDLLKVRLSAFAWVAAAREKRADAPYFKFAAEDLSKEALYEAAGAQGLFFGKSLVLINEPFALKESGDLLLEELPLLKTSENFVVILATKLSVPQIKKLEEHAEKIFAYQKIQKSERGFNTALVNALGNRNREMLWKELQKAFREGDAAEAVHGLLHWKARDMMQKGSARWNKREARNLSVSLIELLSDARSGDQTLPEALEKFALSV